MRHFFGLLLLVFAIYAHGAGGLFGKAASANAGTTYGALAYDVKTRAWAYTVKSPDGAGAAATVSKLCGASCSSYGPFEQCGVLASNGTHVGYGAGSTQAAAEGEAIKICGEACQVAVWACNTMSASEGAGFGVATNHRKNFGAIAFDANTGSFGTVWDYGSFQEAVAGAKSHCDKDCRMYVAQSGDCGVLAKGGRSIAVGTGADYRAAEDMARAKCGNDSCETITWFCNAASR